MVVLFHDDGSISYRSTELSIVILRITLNLDDKCIGKLVINKIVVDENKTFRVKTKNRSKKGFSNKRFDKKTETSLSEIVFIIKKRKML